MGIYIYIYIYINRNKRIRSGTTISIKNISITACSNDEEKVFVPTLDLTKKASMYSYLSFQYIYIGLFYLTGSNINIEVMEIFGNIVGDENYWSGVIFHLRVQVLEGSRSPDIAILNDINITDNEGLGGLLYIDQMKINITDPPTNIPADDYYHIDISQIFMTHCTNCGSLVINIGNYVHIYVHDNYIYNNTFGSSNIYIYTIYIFYICK